MKTYLVSFILFCACFLLTGQAQTPIPCNGYFYHSRYDSGTNSTRIYRINPTPYAESLFASATSGMRFDALAYNNVDGLLYALLSQPYSGNTINTLIQIDYDGSITILGPISGLAPANWVVGTFDGAGNYWVTTESTNTLFKININTLAASSFTVSQSITNAGDIVFNPLDNFLYLTTIDSRLYKIDSVIGATTILPLGGPGVFDASFIDGSGQLYGCDRNGNFAKIDKATGSVTTLNSTASIAEGDGANCPFFVPVTRPIINLTGTVSYLTHTVPGTDLTYYTTFTNNGTKYAHSLSLVQIVAEWTEFKLNSVYVAAPPDVKFIIEYSANFNRRTADYFAAAAAANWTYLPVSGGGGAEQGYDRKVKAIRIRTTNILEFTYPRNEGVLRYQARIQ